MHITDTTDKASPSPLEPRGQARLCETRTWSCPEQRDETQFDALPKSALALNREDLDLMRGMMALAALRWALTHRTAYSSKLV